MSTTIHSADPDTLTNASRIDEGSEIKEKIAQTAEKARSAAADTARSAGDAVQTATQEVRAGVNRASDMARDVTAQQPLLALAGAFAIGVAIGLAVNARR